ncbi:hypothetical protein P153DRAFT_178371 [Dothidotthia symphoricarpi CBS 119687]|uniref:C2H2-type domain-containing protein n=1 Tax=Dothidotthia symphoricarpi CBS 119687 TaxID=1392245 RepID=A0A6A6APF4_9PLEO|nr:uncharacterized protein P153DRAFT_178371 [Dothidotthia symphoricarpi CBS 119687]KAF2133028.1 hypothetical protein P153DRAFT_178371 [Dothidotthia symphoricarpi CBS 119687]
MDPIMSDQANPMTRGRKRREVLAKDKGKIFVCSDAGCGRSFTRAEHLQRHLLNHSDGEYTCGRCRAHFKRRDLLERHIFRHQQKDGEAGAEGCGILNTRKRMWKDSTGRIVTKKPALSKQDQDSQPIPPPQDINLLQSLPDFIPLSYHNEDAPISPPISNNPSLRNPLEDFDPSLESGFPPIALDPRVLTASGSYSPIDQQFWSSSLSQPEPDPVFPVTFDDAPLDEIFNPDTASSFNNPFTTMSNYNWLFDMNLAQVDQIMQEPFPTLSLNTHTVPHTSHRFDLQLDHMNVDRSLSTASQYDSIQSQHTDSPQHQLSSALSITPPPSKHKTTSIRNSPVQLLSQSTTTQRSLGVVSQPLQDDSVIDIEHPMSMLYPSRSLPVIDELARAQILDLIDITQPTMVDGKSTLFITRDHPLLSLSCLQTYCDLYFTRFNTVYPLIHMSTFDPSEADTLLLISVLLLGATYGDKETHKLAVCVHDVLRPQIFANAGFSSKPDLWVLQTILLVECFGKSRAGQKQHDMSHLFHGLLINLIRRSDCQSVRPPTLEDATEDLEDDWQTWCNAEQKKRLAFLCFMWDTQHAVLFCQSLCMSAFELRSDLPCDQSLWEADTAEAWHHLRRKQPNTPLFLTCLKMYLHPEAARLPKIMNVFSRSLLLHGLMSVAWDMQRRDQTSLGVIDTNPLGNWQARLATSYTAWHKDFETFCTQYTCRLPSPDHYLAKEFHVLRAATLALYHSAHILLHTPFLDLQIYAGARHILGRPVARHDYARSQRIVKKWVVDNLPEAGKAIWHAAALVNQGVKVLDDGLESTDVGGGRLWHHPWAVYLGTVVVWGVWHARPVSRDPENVQDDDEIIWDPHADMKTLLDAISKSEPGRLLEVGYTGGVAGGMEKKGINGMTAVVSKCLSKVRWAVVHDGMMVLRGLVQWRLIGGGGIGGM